MPKAPSAPARNESPSTSFKQKINNLKRNQACHQCRKRKLKCDAQRPCTTCTRSHAYAVAHASPTDRLNLPDHPECTYDEVSTTPPAEPAPPAPKSRYERLENRINELETLLRDKATSPTSQPSPASSSSSPAVNVASPVTSVNDFSGFPQLQNDNSFPSPNSALATGGDWSLYFPSTSNDNFQNMEFANMSGGNSLDHLAGIASLMSASPAPTAHIAASTSRPSSSQEQRANVSGSPSLQTDSGFASEGSRSESNRAIVYLSWPANLPDMVTTRHLVHAFFAHHVHASRLFHAPTFFASLDLHPTDPNFPCRAVLHAICAVGSLYTGNLSPQAAISDSYAYDPLTGVRRKGKKRIITFGGQQARFAKDAIEDGQDQGENLFEVMQAQVILTWFYQSQARWVEACLSTAGSLRATIPCSLNVCPPFHGISAEGPSCEKPHTILPNAKTVIEDEMRRNAFWLAYAMERQQAAGTSWAMLLDDKDVAQLLPLRHDQFEDGVLILPPDRQWSHGKDTLYVHPESQTDPFILYIKCGLLLSRIKAFNLRFKALAFAEDPSIVPPPSTSADHIQGPRKVSPRLTPMFLELDNLILTYRNNIPTRLKSPFVDGRLDNYNYLAWNIVHLASIHLHEPYARPGSQSCQSAFKILTASRAIVDLLHAISSSSFDVSLLDIYAFLCWYMAGRVLVRFLKSALDAQAHDQIVSLRAEIAFIRTMLSKAGERIPLAYCYHKMLTSAISLTCGEQEVEPSISALPPKETSYLTPEYDFTANLFSYKTPPMPPEPTADRLALLAQFTATD